MRKISMTFILLIAIASISLGQGPNRAFSKYRKAKKQNLTCTENCAEIVIIFEKGTYVNPIIKGGIGIDDVYAVATEYGTYTRLKISAGKHKITIAQGVDSKNKHEMYLGYNELTEKIDTNRFYCIYSAFSNIDNYCISIGKESKNIIVNQEKDYLQIAALDFTNYTTFDRNFEAGEVYYFKSIKTGVSFNCGPIFSETTEMDYQGIIEGKAVKKEIEPLIYIHPEEKKKLK